MGESREGGTFMGQYLRNWGECGAESTFIYGYTGLLVGNGVMTQRTCICDGPVMKEWVNDTEKVHLWGISDW